ncbi:MAG: glycine C-acetyltransferase [Tepidisphaeraceae bacterium]
MPAAFEQRTNELLKSLRDTGQYKQLRHVTGPLGATARVEGVGEVVVLCSNNYLGLADNSEVVSAGIEGLRQFGAGTASVRFICGTLACHRKIEQTIARFVGAESSLTYVSCWNANEALIPTVAGPDDVLISDELNHASIIDACRLARCERAIYKHADLNELESKLRQFSAKQVKWVITDGVFSMEGAVADLPGIAQLCQKHDAVLVVDDSHGVGVLGTAGRGTPEFHNMLGKIDVLTGTLGKALGGAAGGYVAGRQHLIDLLIQRSRPGLFSNALPATVAFSANKAIEIIEREPQRVKKLHSNVKLVRDGLRQLGFECTESPSAIIPIMIGDAAEAIRKSQRLLDMGVWVVAFGYPVVPQGKARLRVQVSAALESAHIEKALSAFARL